MEEKKKGYTLDHLSNDIHVYHFHDMTNETVDAWIHHRKDYRISIPQDYLDMNILDFTKSPLPSTYAINAATQLGQTANRSKYLYAVIGIPACMGDLLRITSAAVSRWRETEQNLQAFNSEEEAIAWLLKRAEQINRKK
jgi:hypothetical protein